MSDGIFFAMTFAEELMKIIYINEGITWEPDQGMQRIFPQFATHERTIGILKMVMAIEAIVERNSEDIVGCHKDLVENEADTRSGFGYFAMKAAPAYFPYGYSPERLLAFCAMVAGVCRMCHRPDSDNGVLDSAAQVIGMVMSAYTLTGEFDANVLEGLVQVAEKITSVLLGKKNK